MPGPGASSDLLLFVLPSFIWGTTWLAIKFQLGVVEPEVSVGWRFALASLLLLGWCGLRRVPLRFGARDHGRFAVLGLLLFGLNYVLVYRSEESLTSGLVAVLFSLIVFWNLAGARVFFRSPAPRGVLAGAGLVEGGVDAAVRGDQLRQRVDVGALQLGEGAVLEDEPRERVLLGQLLQHVLIGRGAGLEPLHHRQLQLGEEDLRQLAGRGDVEGVAGRRVDPLLQPGHGLAELGAQVRHGPAARSFRP